MCHHAPGLLAPTLPFAVSVFLGSGMSVAYLAYCWVSFCRQKGNGRFPLVDTSTQMQRILLDQRWCTCRPLTNEEKLASMVLLEWRSVCSQSWWTLADGLVLRHNTSRARRSNDRHNPLLNKPLWINYGMSNQRLSRRINHLRDQFSYDELNKSIFRNPMETRLNVHMHRCLHTLQWR